MDDLINSGFNFLDKIDRIIIDSIYPLDKLKMIADGNYTSECPLWPDNPHQCTVVLALQRTFSALSLVGCLFIIFIIWLFRMHQYFVQRLILLLSISAALECISFIIGDIYTNQVTCQFQAFVMQYFGWSTILWVLAITVNILLVVKKIESSRYEKWFHLVCWLVPLLWSCLPFIGDNYGPAGIWCWIKRDATALRFGTWYIPIFFVIAAMTIAYLYIILTVIRRAKQWTGTFNQEAENDKNMMANEVKPLAAFPLIYLLSAIPTLIYRIDDAVHPNRLPGYVLLILSSIFAPSTGALNAVSFALYGEIQKLLTWGQIKSAFLSRFTSSSSRIIHNVEVRDNLPENDALEELDEY